MTTLTVISCCWGEEYAAFIPQWWRGFLSLRRKPDELILGVAEGDEVGFAASVPKDIDAKIVVLPNSSANERWDFLAKQPSSKWFCGAPIDDELLPGAFDEIDIADEAGAEIYVDSIQYRHNNAIWKGHWDCREIAYRMPAPQGIPILTHLHTTIGQKNQYRWADWIFYIDLAKAGVKPYIASTTRLIFDSGIGRSTNSSPSLDRGVREAADAEVREYAKSLGF